MCSEPVNNMNLRELIFRFLFRHLMQHLAKLVRISPSRLIIHSVLLSGYTSSFSSLSRPMSTALASTLPLARPSTVARLSALEAPEIESRYRPYLTLKDEQEADWISQLELDTVTEMASSFPRKVKLLILYGSLRERYVNSNSYGIMSKISLTVLCSGLSPGSQHTKLQESWIGWERM